MTVGHIIEEPIKAGALVAVYYGDYLRQEVWFRSREFGHWYPLGGASNRTTGVFLWDGVLARGPVTLLVGAQGEAYHEGWRAGRQHLMRAIDDLDMYEQVTP